MRIDAEIYRRKEQYDPRCITKLVSNVSAKRPVIVILLVIQVTAVCRLTVCVCVPHICGEGRVHSKTVNQRKNLKYTIKYTRDDHPGHGHGHGYQCGCGAGCDAPTSAADTTYILLYTRCHRDRTETGHTLTIILSTVNQRKKLKIYH